MSGVHDIGRRRRQALQAGLGLLASSGWAPLLAQGKALRLLLPYPAGSGPDAFVRQLGDRLTPVLGAAPLVDNRPGANGFLATGEAKRAAPDGLTLLALDSTHTSLYPLLFKQLPFDLSSDFEPVVPLYQTWFHVVVTADSPYRSLADLLAAARKRDGQLSYASSGIGSVPHAGAAMLEAASGTRMTHVPYRDFQQMFGDLASGRVDWAFGTLATSGALWRAKKLRYLAVAAPARSTEFPDLPTVAESSGLAGFELKAWVGLYAPKGVPPAALARLAAAVNGVLTDPAFSAGWAALGLHAWAGTAADIGRATAADTLRFADVVKRAHIALD